ncbi:MAG: hypothetical protein QW767_04990 [Thermoprotei archaeon]
MAAIAQIGGYLSVVLLELFAISFVSNATPFFGAPYTLVSAGFLAKVGATPDNFLLVVVVTALGAAFAKTVIYAGGLGLRRRLSGSKNMNLLKAWLGRRSFYVALFVAAALPVLPLDDYIYIGAGVNRGRLPPMITTTLFAKLIKGAAEIYLELEGILLVSKLTEAFGIGPYGLSILSSIAFIVLGVLIYQLDWEKILARLGYRPTFYVLSAQSRFR